ncbi:alpha/beta fold hydrolase [filamentous cyanobacterium LEGE 11480]|uniref:Alpha/beta fold hydrolase n=1 Tax=Romeriopsis navalis LEGE 11480 TaxID=2777977 RepID=A0A928VP13_9CYAN|nr:alpha/beta fold hydrolase [Romeriopsis navalis]MBE9032143.1 alpha/beta fold hydrolase [Romeriopsis navalis LEGE 11480]
MSHHPESCTNHVANHVVLVHGMWDTDKIFSKLRPYLESNGFTVHSLNLIPADGSLPLELLADQLAQFITQTLGPDTKFDLIGFSMGGIVSRYYLQRLGGLSRIKHFVTIASPHRGTIVGWLGNTLGAKQMATGSAFLRDLNNDIDQLGPIPFTSIRTPFDLMIVPSTSSEVTTANTYVVPAPLHKLMIYDKRVFAKVIEAIQS